MFVCMCVLVCESVCACARVYVCVHVCARVCARVCVRACVRVCVRAREEVLVIYENIRRNNGGDIRPKFAAKTTLGRVVNYACG